MERNKKFRCHFTIIIEKIWKTLLVVCLILWEMVSEIPQDTLTAGELSEYLVPVLIAAGIIAVLIIYQILVWRYTFIMFDEHSVVMESGRLNTKKKTIALANIANVNIEKNIFESFAGTCKVKLDTNSAGIAGEGTDLVIVLKSSDASAFQALVMSYISHGAQGKTAIDAEEYDHRQEACTRKEIFFHCLCGFNLITICAGVIIFAGFAAIFISAGSEEKESGDFFQYLAVIITVIGYLCTVVQSFFKYDRFTAYREKDRIHISHGFFTRKMYQIPVNRINAVNIVSPAFGRLLHQAYAEVVCAGIGDESKEMALLTLCMPKQKLYGRLQELLPEYADEDMKQKIKKQPAAAWKTAGINYMIITACVAALTFACGSIWGISSDVFLFVLLGAFAFAAVFLLITIVTWRTAGWYFGEQKLILVNGCFKKVTSILPYKKIEHFETKQGPVLRHFGLMKTVIIVKSGFVAGIFESCCLEKEYQGILRKKCLS